MRTLERALCQEGYSTLNLDYDSRHKSLERLSADIRPAIQQFSEQADGPLHFVTHSMGGLLLRLCLARWRPAHLGQVVMLGPPNRGSAMADLLHRGALFRVVFGPSGQQLTTQQAVLLQDLCGPVDYELGVIAGTRSANPLASAFVFREPNDGKVAVSGTRLDGMADHVALPAMHSFMMRNPLVVAATLAFLRDGRFPSDKQITPSARPGFRNR